MPTLLRPWKRTARQEPPPDNLNDIREEPAPPPEEQNMLLLIPADGGLSFRLFRFPDQNAAAAFLAALASPIDPQPRHIAFRALHSTERPREDGPPAEAVVLIRDAHRPGIVDLYSFVDMESADAYVQQEAVAELDPERVMVYWAQPVDLALSERQESAQPQTQAYAQAPAIVIPLPPRPAQKTQRWEAPPPCPTVPTPQPRMPSPGSQTRVNVTPAGAVMEAAEPQRAEENGHTPAVKPDTVAQIRAWGGWDGLAPLLAKAAVGNEDAYRDFEVDPYALGRSRLVLALALVAAAIGAAGSGLASIVVHVPAFGLGWAAFAVTVYAMGTQAFPGRRSPQTLPRLIRVLGLATAPAFLLVMGVIPTYGPLFVLIAYMWILLTTATAVSGPMELNRDSSIIVATVGCLVLFTISQVAPLLLT